MAKDKMVKDKMAEDKGIPRRIGKKKVKGFL